MKSLTRVPSSSLFSTSHRTIPSPTIPPRLHQYLHNTAPKPADPLPITTPGPPPSAPLPAASQQGERIDRRRRQAELLKRGQDLRATHMKPGSAMKKRFWKDVTVQTSNETSTPPSHHTIHLSSRPVRNPATKSLLHIPPSKPHLATAIALEWDLLVSAQQALKQHLIPLTSIASRAEDLALADAAAATSESSTPRISRTRTEIVDTLMRYLDTDTLLCWAPAPSSSSHHHHHHPHSTTPLLDDDDDPASRSPRRAPSLRELQIRAAQPIIAYLVTYVWPGVEIRPALDDDGGSIIPASQPAGTREVIRGWISGLGAWELVGLERAVLAGKSLCVGVRLVVEWGEGFAGLREGVGKGDGMGGMGDGMGDERGGMGDGMGDGRRRRFGVEEAAEACSLEVKWQTGLYGEVEDTHDVEREDVRRQLGSVVLVVSGVEGG